VKSHKTQVVAEAAVGQVSVKVLRETHTYKKTTDSSPMCLFLSSNNVDLKILTESVKKHSECCGCVNSCNKFVSTGPC